MKQIKTESIESRDSVSRNVVEWKVNLRNNSFSAPLIRQDNKMNVCRCVCVWSECVENVSKNQINKYNRRSCVCGSVLAVPWLVAVVLGSQRLFCWTPHHTFRRSNTSNVLRFSIFNYFPFALSLSLLFHRFHSRRQSACSRVDHRKSISIKLWLLKTTWCGLAALTTLSYYFIFMITNIFCSHFLAYLNT